MINVSYIKLQWGTATQQAAKWYLGLFGLYERNRGGRSYVLAISVRGTMLWGLAACVAGYFAAAGYVLWKLEQRPYNFVRYEDLLLYPLRKDEVNRLRGRASIEAGFDELKKNNWRSGVMLLRIGLEKAPDDLRARLEVARFFLAVRQRIRARDTLLGGLAFGYPGRTYLESAVSVATTGEDNEMIIDLCRRGLELHVVGTHSAQDRSWLAETYVRALLAEERNDEALTVVGEHNASLSDVVASEFRVVALLQAKRSDEAITEVEAWRSRARSADQAVALRLQARAYREAGRVDDMVRVIEELRAIDPTDPRQRIFAVIQYLLAGLEAEARPMLDDFLFRFGGEPDNLLSMAEPLAAISRRAEFDLVKTAVEERGIRDIRLLVARLELLVAERNWVEAAAQLEYLRSVLPPEALAGATLLDFMKVLIAAAASPVEGLQSTFIDYVAPRQFPMSLYRQAIKVLRSADRHRTAHEVARLASLVYPENRYLRNTLAEIEPELRAAREADAASRVTRAMRPVFADAEAFHAELKRVREADGAEAALAFFRELRGVRPNWLEVDNERLDRREMELRAELSDPVLLQAAVRRYINPDRVRIDHTLEVARRLYGIGRAIEARVVLDEILRRVPNEPAAAALRLEWFPPPPPEPELEVKAESEAPATTN